jgi:phosphate starvation-inducible PhoH-like protein
VAKGKLSDLKIQWSPRGPAQQLAKELWRKSSVMIFNGPAGTGKTSAALGLALSEIQRTGAKLLLSRPMVFCEEQTGFLPGDLNAKVGAWLGPFQDVYGEMAGEGDWQKFLATLGTNIEFVPVGMMRGRTIRGVLIVDEAQGLSYAQLTCILTRVGDGGRIILCGDPQQSDRFSASSSPLSDVCRRLQGLDEVSVIHFTAADQQRSELVNKVLERL